MRVPLIPPSGFTSYTEGLFRLTFRLSQLNSTSCPRYHVGMLESWNMDEDMVIEDKPGSARETQWGADRQLPGEQYCIATKSSAQETGTASIPGLGTVRRRRNQD